MGSIAIHLAFPDGALHYRCSSCDQRCCKAGGLALFGGEREALLQRYPALDLVTPDAGEGLATLPTPRGGCWFLDGGGCTLVDAHGGRLRPAACSLFPFNIFGELAGALVVAPNALCPLQVAPGAGVTHDDVLRLLGRHGAAGDPPAPIRPGASTDLLALERVIRDAAAASLGEASVFPLLAFQQLATAAYEAGGAAGLATLDLQSLDSVADALQQRWTEQVAVLAIAAPSAAAQAAMAPLLAAFTPSLRLFAFNHLPLAQVPGALQALALHTAHWQTLRPSRPLVPQTLMQLVGSLGPTLALLAAWNEPWTGPAMDALGLQPGAAPAATVQLADDPIERAMQLRRAAATHVGRPAEEIAAP